MGLLTAFLPFAWDRHNSPLMFAVLVQSCDYAGLGSPPPLDPRAKFFSDKCVGSRCLERVLSLCPHPSKELHMNRCSRCSQVTCCRRKDHKCDSQKLYPGSKINLIWLYCTKPITALKISLWCKCMKWQLHTGGDLWNELFFVFLKQSWKTFNMQNCSRFEMPFFSLLLL